MAAEVPPPTAINFTTREKEVYIMSVKSPACQRLVAELLRAPEDSVDHHIATYVKFHKDPEVLNLAYLILTEDPADSRAHAIARELWPFVQFTAMQQVVAAVVAPVVSA